MDPGNTLCSMCGKRTADMFCACTLPETFLCVNCVGPHNLKRGGRPHTIWPLDQLAYYRIPGYSEGIQKRLEQFPQVRAQVLQQVALVDKAIQEFTDVMERTISELLSYSNEKTGELQQIRAELSRDIDTALEEVERTLVDDRPQLASRYGSVFRSLTEAMQPFELFSYSLETFSPKYIAAFQCKLHSPQDIYVRDKFVALSRKKLTVLDLKTQQSTHHILEIDTGYPGCISLDRNTLMIVGKQVLTLDLLTFRITTQPPLLTPRSNPGVINVGDTVFAFGGYDGTQLTVCEKWSRNQQWNRLMDMQYARSAFTPCHFKSLIYLASTRAEGHKAVESFNPHTETFTVLPVSLPSQLTLNCASVAFIANGELCLLTNEKQMARWVIETGREFRLSAISRECWSIQQPLIVGTQVLIANGDEVMKFSLETYSFL